MSASPPPAPPASDRAGRAPFWRLSLRTWLLIAAAFAIGLLLFALLWSGKRGHDFYRAAPAIGPDTAHEYEPLPAPLPADGSPAAAPAEDDDTAAEEPPRIVERAAAPPPTAQPPPAAPRASDATAAGATPVPIQMPAPRYPPQAARRGVGGTVRVRVEVGADGVPTAVALVDGSGARELDRAAMEAVRRWRFRPGQVDGQPVAGSVVVPIEFALRR